MDVLTESQLLNRIGAGDQAALGIVFERYASSVFRFALVELHSREDAEDITQETYLKLAFRARNITIHGESLLPWLLVTCRNLCRNKQRARLREMNRQSSLDASELVSTGSTERTVEFQLLRTAVQSAVDALASPDRQLFDLCIDGDMSYQKAADTLGLSHGSVRNRLSRIRAQLRQNLSTNPEVTR